MKRSFDPASQEAFWAEVEQVRPVAEEVKDILASKIIIFAFDEASGLLDASQSNLFCCMRNALAEIFPGFSVCGIFTDTSSRVGNFAPTVRRDPVLERFA